MSMNANTHLVTWHFDPPIANICDWIIALFLRVIFRLIITQASTQSFISTRADESRLKLAASAFAKAKVSIKVPTF